MAFLARMETPKGTIIFRTPKLADAKGLREHINRLIKEDTFILASGPLNVKLSDERKWLQSVLRDMRSGNNFCALVEWNGKIVGLSDLKRQGANATTARLAHVGMFGIALSEPELRGLGVGEKLARLVLARAKGMGLKLVQIDVFENNDVARSLYRKLGYEQCGRIPGAIEFKGTYVDRILLCKVVE